MSARNGTTRPINGRSTLHCRWAIVPRTVAWFTELRKSWAAFPATRSPTLNGTPANWSARLPDQTRGRQTSAFDFAALWHRQSRRSKQFEFSRLRKYPRSQARSLTAHLVNVRAEL